VVTGAGTQDLRKTIPVLLGPETYVVVLGAGQATARLNRPFDIEIRTARASSWEKVIKKPTVLMVVMALSLLLK
jgi:hypothetical protein